MGVALALDHVVRGRDAAAADLVHDLEAHRRKLLLLDDLRHRAAENVGAGARAVVHHDLDRLRRLELRERGSGAGGDQRERRLQQEQYLAMVDSSALFILDRTH